ncbi:GNAT family N-acetyltransferase [Yersinia pseudotuberculosis]|uniref:GNAT family N-acetyltransferase n=1 Tax=Yersinia pseudotuberculosis TaxID=633 RepID=UPI0005E9372C|nr:GNAT family N-acetyltransferase [Yersinia pseudotuberculosis]CND59374.1 Uncharacterised protein [Yersinia pseudotuberculosis]
MSEYYFRLALKSDIAFIMSEVITGASKKVFTSSLCSPTEAKQFEKNLIKIVELASAGRSMADYLYICAADSDDAPVGFMLITGVNGAGGKANHLELRMIGVKNNLRRKGIASLMVTEMLSGNPAQPFVAHCLPAASSMASLLSKYGFYDIDITKGGKRTLQKLPS